METICTQNRTTVSCRAAVMCLGAHRSVSKDVAKQLEAQSDIIEQVLWSHLTALHRVRVQ